METTEIQNLNKSIIDEIESKNIVIRKMLYIDKWLIRLQHMTSKEDVDSIFDYFINKHNKHIAETGNNDASVPLFYTVIVEYACKYGKKVKPEQNNFPEIRYLLHDRYQVSVMTGQGSSVNVDIIDNQ